MNNKLLRGNAGEKTRGASCPPVSSQVSKEELQMQLFLLVQDKQNLEFKVKTLQQENLFLKKCLKYKMDGRLTDWVKPYEEKLEEVLKSFDTCVSSDFSDLEQKLQPSSSPNASSTQEGSEANANGNSFTQKSGVRRFSNTSSNSSSYSSPNSSPRSSTNNNNNNSSSADERSPSSSPRNVISSPATTPASSLSTTQLNRTFKPFPPSYPPPIKPSEIKEALSSQKPIPKPSLNKEDVVNPPLQNKSQSSPSLLPSTTSSSSSSSTTPSTTVTASSLGMSSPSSSSSQETPIRSEQGSVRKMAETLSGSNINVIGKPQGGSVSGGERKGATPPPPLPSKISRKPTAMVTANSNTSSLIVKKALAMSKAKMEAAATTTTVNSSNQKAGKSGNGANSRGSVELEEEDEKRRDEKLDVDSNLAQARRKRLQSIKSNLIPKSMQEHISNITQKNEKILIFEKTKGKLIKEYILSDETAYNTTKVSLIATQDFCVEPVSCLVVSQDKELKCNTAYVQSLIKKGATDLVKECANYISSKPEKSLPNGELFCYNVKENKQIKSSFIINVYAGDMGRDIFKIQERMKYAIYNVMECADTLNCPSICLSPLGPTQDQYGVDKSFWIMALHEIFISVIDYYLQHRYSCSIMDIRLTVASEQDGKDVQKMLDSDYQAHKNKNFATKDVGSIINAGKLTKELKDKVEGKSLSSTVTSPSSTSLPQEKIELDPNEYYIGDWKKIEYIEKPDTAEYIEWMDDGQIPLQIKCATVEKLIERVTYHKDYDNAYLYAFLLTYRTFTTPHDLMEQLMQRYNITPKKDITKQEFGKWYHSVLSKIRLRITQVIKYWIENHFHDFDDELMKQLNAFCDMMNKTGGTSFAKQLKRAIERQKEDKKQTLHITSSIPQALYPKKYQKGKENIDFKIMDWHPKEIARQITLIEYDMFREIRPKECLNQSWNKDQREQKAPNIFKMINWFNDVSRWAASEVVKEQNQKQRTTRLNQMIEIANECRILNNFNAVFEIISGLNNAAIHRMKKTWESLKQNQRRVFEDLEALVSRDNNFRSLRNAIVHLKPPCIPYIGVFLTDLTFIEDGNPNILNDKLNFIKRRKLAMLIRDLQTYQQTPYELEEVAELQKELLSIKPLPEDELYEESLKREPRRKTN